MPGVRRLERHETRLGLGSHGSCDDDDDLHLQCTGHGGPASASATVTLLGATGTVAGNLLVPTISRSDSDVNDPLVPAAPNDSDLQAQVMPNPVVIGGYVNLAGAGEPGQSFANGDPEDWYRMDLVRRTSHGLVIPSASAFVGGDNADLRLFDSNLMIRGNSAGTGQIEQIKVPATDTYFIRVLAFDGEPLYRLSVGQATAPSGGSSLSLNDDFVPGEVIVTLKSAGDATARTATSDAVLTSRYKTSRKGGEPDRAMLLTLPTDAAKIAAGITPSSPQRLRPRRRALPCPAVPRPRRPLAGVSRARRSSASSILSSMPSCCAGTPTCGAPTSTA